MPENEPTPDQIVQALYISVAEQIERGVPVGQIERDLVERGLTEEQASTVVTNVKQARAQAIVQAGKRNMLYGALWCVGGLIVTVVTMQAAAGGGTYVVAWGAILFGGIQFFRGMMQSSGE